MPFKYTAKPDAKKPKGMPKGFRISKDGEGPISKLFKKGK